MAAQAAGRDGHRPVAVTARPLRFVHDVLPVRVRFGEPAVEALADEVRAMDARKLLVIASPRHDALVAALIERLPHTDVARFTDVRRHVPFKVAESARAAAGRIYADTVVAIGGGSAIGTAKAVALAMPVRLLAVPTTYAGSEATPIWGLSAPEGKTTGRNPTVAPSRVVYDPEMLRTLPAREAAASGLNAVAHAVEALYAPGANPVTDLLALDGLERLVRWLPAAVADPADAVAVTAALHGAYLAGTALGQAGTSFHHKVCHVLGGDLALAHAATHAALLPHSVVLATELWPDAAARMTVALGTDDAAATIAGLVERLDTPRSLHGLGLGEDDVPRIAARAAAELADAGLGVDATQVEWLLRRAY